MEEAITTIGITLGCSLINFISTKVYNLATGSSKNFLWKDQKIDLKQLETSSSFEELKRLTRIVVIDDENSFPVQIFQDEGYSIDKWDIVKDYNKLENGYYDIIVLDIKGVAQHISENDGLGVLQSLKKQNPAQIVISYSQHSYDLSKIQFFQLADENIAKPSDYLKIKSIINNLISSKFKSERYISALTHTLQANHVNPKDIEKYNFILAKSIKSKKNPDWDKSLEFIEHRPDLVKQTISLSKTILKFYK
ncbi:hypothetical protein [Flavobacterium sp.]|uniref:hypothetical protein n=1 Tax=Flavobacterium sp. TaxID=239 RepID=UPI0028BF581B|nr:hypothetical protein [Flavobacterium sp.]